MRAKCEVEPLQGIEICPAFELGRKCKFDPFDPLNLTLNKSLTILLWDAPANLRKLPSPLLAIVVVFFLFCFSSLVPCLFRSTSLEYVMVN